MRADEITRSLRPCKLTTERPAEGVLFTRLDGHMDVAAARRIVDAGNQVIREHGRLLVFHDWEEMLSYDTEARHVLTSWAKEIDRSVERAHILFRSKLVAMGVSVAAMALGGMLTAHPSRTSFVAARRDALATRKPRAR
jgi:hypothetical protein